jgi:hypothetical protein
MVSFAHRTHLSFPFKIKCCVNRLRPPPDCGHVAHVALLGDRSADPRRGAAHSGELRQAAGATAAEGRQRVERTAASASKRSGGCHSGAPKKKAPAPGLGEAGGAGGFLIRETKTHLVITGTMTGERLKFRLGCATHSGCLPGFSEMAPPRGPISP